MAGNYLSEVAKAEMRANAKKEPTLREANFTIFLILFITGMIFFAAYFMRGLTETQAMILAVLAFAGMMTFGIFGYRSKIFYLKRVFFYISYSLAGACITLAMCAVLIHYDCMSLLGVAYSALALSSIAILNLIILSIGKLERLLSFLILLTSIAILIFGIVLWTKGDISVGIPLFFAGLSLCALETAIVFYVFSGDSFFEILALSYIFFALLAFIIAILIVLQADSCDCDCAPDCSLSSGGRRAKQKLKDQLSQTINTL